MSCILVVDDSGFCRELVAEALKHAGYHVLCATNGQEGLDILSKNEVGLIVLDVEMPEMNGMALLEKVRETPAWSELPVIMLTGNSKREIVLVARQLKISGYLIKSALSVENLLERVSCLLRPDKNTTENPTASMPHRLPAPLARTNTPTVATPQHGIKQITKAEILRAADEHQHIRSLGGAVSQALAFANSPHGSIHDIAEVIQQDPALSARVFQMANSAAFAGARRAKTIDEAVRNIGTGGVRSLAMSAGVIESFSSGSAGGAQLLRCWQHGLAVAMLTDVMTEGETNIRPGVSHLIGLCHDIAEIFLRQAFPEVYRQASAAAEAARTPIMKILPEYLALSFGEVTAKLVDRSQLPDEVARPIVQYANDTGGRLTGVLPKALRLADLRAHGLLLASSPDVPISPILLEQCRGMPDNVKSITDRKMRSEVIATSCVLGRLSGTEEAQLMQPLIPPTDVRVLYVRDESIAACDPLEEALRLLCQLTTAGDKTDWTDNGRFGAIVIAATHTAAPALLEQVRAKLGDVQSTPTLILTPHELSSANALAGVKAMTWPVVLRDLHSFLTQAKDAMSEHTTAAAP